jgi:hypothetical protein
LNGKCALIEVGLHHQQPLEDRVAQRRIGAGKVQIRPQLERGSYKSHRSPLRWAAARARFNSESHSSSVMRRAAVVYRARAVVGGDREHYG